MQPLSAQESPVRASSAAMPFEVRGRFFTAVVVRLKGAADEAFLDALDALMQKAPSLFANAPLVLDLEQATGLDARDEVAELAGALSARKLFAIGIQNATPRQSAAALGAGLVTLKGGRDAPAEPGRAPVRAVPKPPEPAEPPEPTMLITEPVRSGQRVFADRGDLIVTTSVGSGAELIAHGNIHVYGALRGRALAGVNGDESARIFCQSLEAELIAIAGLYQTSEDLGPAVLKQRVQAFLHDETLCIEPLK